MCINYLCLLIYSHRKLWSLHVWLWLLCSWDDFFSSSMFRSVKITSCFLHLWKANNTTISSIWTHEIVVFIKIPKKSTITNPPAATQNSCFWVFVCTSKFGLYWTIVELWWFCCLWTGQMLFIKQLWKLKAKDPLGSRLGCLQSTHTSYDVYFELKLAKKVLTIISHKQVSLLTCGSVIFMYQQIAWEICRI